jgi:NADPH:quinone reductase-like Zn-dependent oxidoreductase
VKAIVYTHYGPPEVLQLRELDKPVPADDEVLVRVHATTVTAGDYRIRGFDVPAEFWLPARLGFGVLGPRKQIPGSEFAGEIEAVGKAVTRFKVGDQVFGIDGNGFGAYAEYTCRPETAVLAHKPRGISCEEAAAVPFGALTALHFLRDKGNLQRGQKVLVYGASGGVGTAAVQLARHFGASVSAVCSSANLDLVRSLGAERVFDYTREDVTESGERYDIIFDTVGKMSFTRCRKLLEERGLFLATVFRLPQLVQMLWTSVSGGRKIICSVAPERASDLVFLAELIDAGAIRPVIDRRYTLEQAAEAHRYAEQGHKKGNVVITVP